jgi:hypothetical protein
VLQIRYAKHDTYRAEVWTSEHYAHLRLQSVKDKPLEMTAHIESIKYGPLDLLLVLPPTWPFAAPVVSISGDQTCIKHPMVNEETRSFENLEYNPAMTIATFLMAFQLDILDADEPLMAVEIPAGVKGKRKQRGGAAAGSKRVRFHKRS